IQIYFLFFFNDTATTEIYTLSLHDALPISTFTWSAENGATSYQLWVGSTPRSEEHTSELQSRENLVCRLLLEKKKYTSTHIADRLKSGVTSTSRLAAPLT